MKKRIPLIAALCALPLLGGIWLLHCLETYNATPAHSNSAGFISVYCLAAIISAAIIWWKNRKFGKIVTVVWLLSTLILLFVLLTCERIPFCVECDHTTAEDLGFLIHWIKPLY